MSRPTCETCRFWDRSERLGMCRIRAPTQDQNADAIWPWTSFNDWCGEHAPAKEGGEDA